jgi:membrane-associated protease RseP (regulator of RpoE activity)
MAESNSPFPSSTIEYYYRLPEPEGVAPSPRYWLHGLLLLATCFTTLVVGAKMEFNFLHGLAPFVAGNEYLPFFPLKWVLQQPSRLLLGIPFSATLLTILLAHEMGHYLYCRYYGVRATLPFFIPAPTLIGTLGAVIRIRGRIRTRAALFDIGIAGPIAGFLVAVVCLGIALGISKPLPPRIGPSDIQMGFPEIFFLMHRLMRVFAPDRAVSILPLAKIYLHPMAVAAWVGMYATALNLIPSSQLDGGHIVYALAPRAHRAISWITVLALAYLGRVNYVWWFWAGLITVMNILTYRQMQAPDYPTLPPNRWLWAVVAMGMLGLTLTVSPFQTN